MRSREVSKQAIVRPAFEHAGGANRAAFAGIGRRAPARSVGLTMVAS